MTNPILIGILNALVPGVGYLMVRERIVFGAFMLLGTVLLMLVMLVDPSPIFDSMLYAVTPFGRAMETLSYLLIAGAFGYDAYDLARVKRIAPPTV